VNVLAWGLQILLAVAFLASGALKVVQPKEKLRAQMTWVEHFTAAQVKAIGAVEVLGALGLILPAVTSIAVILVPLAALGLALVMAGAAVTHLRIKDPVAMAAPAIVLGLLSLVLAILRFGPAQLS